MWLYGVDRTCAEMAAGSCGTSHVTSKQCCEHTTSVDIKTTRCVKAAVTCSESDVSLLRSKEKLYNIYESDLIIIVILIIIYSTLLLRPPTFACLLNLTLWILVSANHTAKRSCFFSDHMLFFALEWL